MKIWKRGWNFSLRRKSSSTGNKMKHWTLRFWSGLESGHNITQVGNPFCSTFLRSRHGHMTRNGLSSRLIGPMAALLSDPPAGGGSRCRSRSRHRWPHWRPSADTWWGWGPAWTAPPGGHTHTWLATAGEMVALGTLGGSCKTQRFHLNASGIPALPMVSFSPNHAALQQRGRRGNSFSPSRHIWKDHTCASPLIFNEVSYF